MAAPAPSLFITRQPLCASCSHVQMCDRCASQYNFVPSKLRWCSATGKVTNGLTLHWPCINNSLLRQ